MGIMANYYKILDVPQSASMNDIKKAYRSKVLRWHPDKNPENRKEAEQKFKEIVEAYKVLSDKNTRDHYDGSSKDTFKETKKAEAEKHLSVFDQDGIKIFFTGKRSSSDFSVSFFSAPKRFHHFSIMTAIVNGRRITTKRHLENESKYLEVEEDGKTVSIHVNGIPVYGREINQPTGNDWDYRPDSRHFCPNKWRVWTLERRRWADEWRCWASKWRDWAEECRHWVEGGQTQENKGSPGTHARHHQTDTSKGREQHIRPDKGGGPKTGGRSSEFPMPGAEKCDPKERYARTNKGQGQPDEGSPKTDKDYFVFPKPGEMNCGRMDEDPLKTNKSQHRAEEGHAEQEGHGRTKKAQPRSEGGQSRHDKVHHRSERPMQGSLDSMKHKAVFECKSQAGNRESSVKKHGEQCAEENNPCAGKSYKIQEMKDEKLESKSKKGGSTLDSKLDKGTVLNGTRSKSTDSQPDPHELLTSYSARGHPVKRKDLQNWTRKLHRKRSKSRGRSRPYTSRSKSQKNRILDDQQKEESERNDISAGSGKAWFEEETSAECKGAPKSRRKGPLPPLQGSESPFQSKKRLLRRRTRHLTLKNLSDKYQPASETSQLLDINGQQRERLMKVLQPSAQLPHIQAQKLGMNQMPKVSR
ncbi:uncharacterized protein LOC134295313 [Anolis carolinensis]|uniref:uncharacterized protein LOC134295313 n=1 Tax=Anolis carolinensis TaxID=28377 RepID=UPI002F2B1DFE